MSDMVIEKGRYSAVQRLRPRVNLGSKPSGEVPLPGLIRIQKDSYASFLQADVPVGKRLNQGIQAAFSSIFPIMSHSGHMEIEFKDYTLGKSVYDVAECKKRGLTYGASFKVVLRLIIRERDQLKAQGVIKDIKEQEVYFGEMPFMTDKGSFVVNGTERVIVSQLHRAPGVLFEHDGGRMSNSGKLLYSARIIPYRGAWLDFEFDLKNNLYTRIDRRRKIPATIIIKALGYSDDQILALFYDLVEYKLSKKHVVFDLNTGRIKGVRLPVDIKDKSGEVIVHKDERVTGLHIKKITDAGIKRLEVPHDYLHGKVSAKTIVDKKTGEMLVAANQVIDVEVLDSLLQASISSLFVIYTNELDRGAYISDTLALDYTESKEDALNELYRMMRPGEPPSAETAANLFRGMFFEEDRYDLSKIGRMKINLRLNLSQDKNCCVLTAEDIIAVIKYLVDIRDGRVEIDDIDNLGNRRIRSVGELVENYLRVGLVRLERVAKERLGHPDTEDLTPQGIVNTNSVVSSLNDFFALDPLSQFADQNNPLAEITHRRRISALGKGGLTRDRAGFEVRDVHHTHYGRLCPIETPEGPNIGLINSLALYARVNEYGFLETPVRRVKNGRVIMSDIVYLSAIEEGRYIIAQANTLVDGKGKILEDFASCRYQGEFTMKPFDKVDYIDVSPDQVVAVAAALIPFLEHDDANRALMGSNMQRQAVPVLRAEKPLVGTGIEQLVASDAGVSIVARTAGVVAAVDASQIIVKVKVKRDLGEMVDYDVYDLVKYERSNQNTCMNQRPVVEAGQRVKVGEILADGTATDLGELALGQNMLVAFMPWNGYNFEDSILISDKVVRDDRFTSIHIHELVCIARETKLGNEEITADIPNISEQALGKLDESGIVYVGAEVSAGDILVGKVAPKSESMLTPEEKLLRAIFGEKASDVKDCPLRVSPGASGVVIDVQVFTREGCEKNQRAKQIEEKQFSDITESLNRIKQMKERALIDYISSIIKDSVVRSAPGLKAGSKCEKAYLSKLTIKNLSLIEMKEDRLNKEIENILDQIKLLNKEYNERIIFYKKRLMKHDDLAPGVLCVVKVYLAVKRRIQPGDKMAGRHGNKGVISKIVPQEDMPCLPDGTSIDVVLNPLGVPSRMNVGQILEMHLGWAAKELGNKIDFMLREKASSKELRDFIKPIYQFAEQDFDFDSLSDKEIKIIAQNLRKGVPFATPVFNGVKEEVVKKLLVYAGLNPSGRATLFDGRTGKNFDREVSVGYMYIIKLHHLVDDKMHARSTGSYSLVTQQPLGGKAQLGGQRFGEMEVWALQAYGAAYTLQEMLTVKSDDLSGRTMMYKSIVNGDYQMEASIPESFKVLMWELRALCLNIQLKRHVDLDKGRR